MKTIWPSGMKGKELFCYIKANKSAIIDMKKSVTKHADAVTITMAKKANRATKDYLFENDEQTGTLKRTIVMNTYNWLDSHDDVHQNNLFAKSIKDRGNKIPHLHDHIFQLDARVGMPISWQEKAVPWSDLGVDEPGNTMCLLCESEIMKDLNKQVYKDYLNGRIDQHSVGMQYVKLDMAINDPDYEDEYKVWQSTIDSIGNKSDAIDQGYYFVVYEAKLAEGSCVLLGSNELTPTLGQKFEPLKDTQEKSHSEPPKPLDVKSLVEKYYKV
ncbi:MAG TPA: hypothetical protein VL443_29965 [Cyclobacteriaceae bacterium]|jgi:hypothetical protein|nr:hypothetical protein [Cyclobacteriaceae bacterium]